MMIRTRPNPTPLPAAAPRLHRPLFAAALLTLAAIHIAQPAGAKTIDLNMVVVCPDPAIVGGNLCAPAASPWDGYADEEALQEGLFRRVGEMNLEYQPLGISFRPRITLVLEDELQLSGLTNSSGMSALTGAQNEDLVAELRETYALAEPTALTLMLLPNVNKCWAGPPPKPPESMHGVICSPLAGGQVYAHEVGHFFCLRHTMTFADPGNSTNVVDHDYDNGGTTFGDILSGWYYGYYDFGIHDTPPDPGPREGSDQNAQGGAVAHREWCETTLHDGSNSDPDPVDPGSPHATWCEIDCFRSYAGGVVLETAYNPHAHNAMSYYGGGCQGPYVKDGVRREAFSEDQLIKMEECIDEFEERQDLVDMCPGAMGYDFDNDGWCGYEDGCPFVTATFEVDGDGDGVPDACDVCPLTADDQTDTDLDGHGDACDNDDDNDGCADNADEHPKESMYPSGKYFGPLCSFDDPYAYSFEGADPDGDGLLSCEDPDNDNDGILDDKDECPATTSKTCSILVSCPGIPVFWWAICLFGGCNMVDLRIESVINPADQVVFPEVRVLGDSIYVHTLPGKTLSETAVAFLGEPLAAPGGFAAIAFKGEAGKRRARLIHSKTGKVVADLGEFTASALAKSSLERGQWLHFQPPAQSEYCIPGAPTCTAVPKGRLGGTWALGMSSEEVPKLTKLRDKDLDGVPNMADRCGGTPDPLQRDADADGVGDACDADLDNDGAVTEADLKIAAECEGVDLKPAPEYPTHSDDSEEQEFEAPAPPYSNFKAECAKADFDRSGKVDKADVALVFEAQSKGWSPSGAVSIPPAGCCLPSVNNQCTVLGDLDGKGDASVVDVQCAIVTSLAALAGAEPPACNNLYPAHADVNCDGSVSVADVLVIVSRALGKALPSAIDANGDGCPEACQAGKSL